jgi:oxygen-independent coproporphyrinogen-3 oxidase
MNFAITVLPMPIPEFPDSAPPWIAPRAAYVHIPFCAHHCGYCDFAVAAGQDHRIDLYLEALGVELATLGSPRRIGTLFLGGGTPSHLDLQQLARLMTDLRRWFPGTLAEVTLEANPDSFNLEKAKLLAEFGVTRVSIGVQSFHAGLLRTLERQHEPKHIAPAVAAARLCGMTVSLDLIFGVPGQTLDQWDADLRQALGFEPDHVSTYGLTFEKGTRLWKQRERGEVTPVVEELEVEMYRHAMTTLEAAGYEQYEISNFARPGCRSRHNQVYWANEAFYGFGVGAAAYVGGTRTLNLRNLENYLKHVLAGDSPVFQSETLDPEQRARETMAMNLRRAEGIVFERFREQTGFDASALVNRALDRYTAAGLLVEDGVGSRLTRAGRCVADAIVTELF